MNIFMNNLKSLIYLKIFLINWNNNKNSYNNFKMKLLFNNK
jgi:hypothetical protein